MMHFTDGYVQGTPVSYGTRVTFEDYVNAYDFDGYLRFCIGLSHDKDDPGLAQTCSKLLEVCGDRASSRRGVQS